MKVNEEKMAFGIGISVIMVGAWILTVHWTGLMSSLSTVIGGLTAVYAVYCGAHVSNAWVSGKNGNGYQQDLEADARVVAQGKEDDSK